MFALSLAVAAAAGVLVAPLAQATTYTDLCASVPSACQYAGPDAPLLAADVCWDRSTSRATLKTSASCPANTWPYFAKYGLVDPLTSTVTPFQALDDACSRPGLCQPGSFAPPFTNQAPVCCFGDICYPSDGEGCYGGEFLYCLAGVTNEDGTVTCFESL